MVIAWILFASTGVLTARYYKFLGPNSDICGLKLWFILHRSFMLLATVLSIAGFVIIFAQLNWNWVSMTDGKVFLHSIFGIVAIVIAVIQVKFIDYMKKKFKYIFYLPFSSQLLLFYVVIRIVKIAICSIMCIAFSVF